MRRVLPVCEFLAEMTVKNENLTLSCAGIQEFPDKKSGDRRRPESGWFCIIGKEIEVPLGIHNAMSRKIDENQIIGFWLFTK
jgi:hypothetical protein